MLAAADTYHPDAPRRLSAIDGRYLFSSLHPTRRNVTASGGGNSAVMVARNRSTVPQHITAAMYRAGQDFAAHHYRELAFAPPLPMYGSGLSGSGPGTGCAFPGVACRGPTGRTAGRLGRKGPSRRCCHHVNAAVPRIAAAERRTACPRVGSYLTVSYFGGSSRGRLGCDVVQRSAAGIVFPTTAGYRIRRLWPRRGLIELVLCRLITYVLAPHTRRKVSRSRAVWRLVSPVPRALR